MVQNRGSLWKYDFLHTETIRLLEKTQDFSSLRKRAKSNISLFVLLLHFLCTLPILLFFSHVSSQSTFSYFAVDYLKPTTQWALGTFPRIKWPGREFGYSPSPNVEIKNVCRHKFTLPLAFTAYTATIWTSRRNFAPSSLPLYYFVYLLQCVLVTKSFILKPCTFVWAVIT